MQSIQDRLLVLVKVGLLFLLGAQFQVQAAGCSFNCDKAIEHNVFSIPGQLSTELHLFSTDPAPTVILSHGSGGKWEHQTRWAEALNEEGFHAVIIDHFTEKNIRPHTGRTNYDSIPEVRVKDLVAVARWIQNQTWNQGGIGVIGFSQGGSGVNLLANTEQVQRISGITLSDLNRFAAFVSYYPGCGIIGGTPPTDPYAPTMIHIGLADTLAEPFWGEAGFSPSANLTIHKYKDAPHSFDVEIPNWKRVGVVPGVGRKWIAEGHEPSNSISRQRTFEFLNHYLK